MFLPGIEYSWTKSFMHEARRPARGFPTKNAAAVNLKTARALGVTISANDPQSRRPGHRVMNRRSGVPVRQLLGRGTSCSPASSRRRSFHERREFIAGLGATTAWPLAARAQRPDRVKRIGVLLPHLQTTRNIRLLLNAFLQGCND